MNLTGPAGDSLQLRIHAYAFPDAKGDDADWLVIDGAASAGGRAWSWRHPSLQTSEIAALARWLEGIAHGSTFPDACDFAEPNLSFELVRTARDRTELRAYVASESRPPWAPADAGERDVWVTLTPSREEAAAAASALWSALAVFPGRAPQAPGSCGGGCGGSCG